MRKDKFFAHGFTVAEVMIALLISAIVATAMVPVIGLKKVRHPKTNRFHGVAECYYTPGSVDADGNVLSWDLKSYYVASGSNGTVTSRVLPAEEDHCTITLPKASHYKIITVGAGGNSIGDPSDLGFGYKDSDADLMGDGFIRVDDNYQSDIASVKTKKYDRNNKLVDSSLSALMRTLLHEWSTGNQKDNLYAEYKELKSPIGKGGRAKCMAVVLGGECSSMCNFGSGDASLCNRLTGGPYYSKDEAVSLANSAGACWFYLHAKGGDSGKGAKTLRPIRVLLDENVNISTQANTQQASIKVTREGSDSEIKLVPSSNGGDAEIVNGSLRKGDKGELDATCSGNGPLVEYCVPLKVEDDSKNSGADCGIEDPLGQRKCSASNESNQKVTPGAIVYGTRTEIHTSTTMPESAGLYWRFLTKQIVPKIVAGGTAGKQQMTIYEELNGPLYMYPTNPSMVDRTYSYVSTKPENEDPEHHKTIARAGSGSPGGVTTLPMSVEGIQLPIPDEFVQIAAPSRLTRLSYLQELLATGFDGGIVNCAPTGTVNVDNNWCPGYPGGGIYFYLQNIPKLTTLTVTNLFSGFSYSKSPGYNAADENEVWVPGKGAVFYRDTSGLRYDGKCLDGEMAVSDGLNNVNFESYIGSSGHMSATSIDGTSATKYIPKYCKEKKRSGNGGAVIILW